MPIVNFEIRNLQIYQINTDRNKYYSSKDMVCHQNMKPATYHPMTYNNQTLALITCQSK